MEHEPVDFGDTNRWRDLFLADAIQFGSDARPLKERLWEVLEVQLEDQRNGWQMQPDGEYRQLHAGKGATSVARQGSHTTMMKRTTMRSRQ